MYYKMHILVKHPYNKTIIPILVETSETVLRLKERLCDITSYSINDQCLIYNKQQLRDTDMCNFEEDGIIHLLVRLYPNEMRE